MMKVFSLDITGEVESIRLIIEKKRSDEFLSELSESLFSMCKTTIFTKLYDLLYPETRGMLQPLTHRSIHDLCFTTLIFLLK